MGDKNEPLNPPVPSREILVENAFPILSVIIITNQLPSGVSKSNWVFLTAPIHFCETKHKAVGPSASLVQTASLPGKTRRAFYRN